MLKEEFQYYVDNQSELFQKYPNKYLVIKGQEVQGAYDEQLTAYNAALGRFELGTFLLQHCTAGEDSYTQIFRSRVSFSEQ
jgi:hypothetical protein